MSLGSLRRLVLALQRAPAPQVFRVLGARLQGEEAVVEFRNSTIRVPPHMREASW
jgi:hypothetical protein